MSTKRLLGIFAHPDDEGLIGGALLHYHAQGVETGIIYATRGDVGEISDPILAAPDNLGEVREKEARAAASLLGVQHLWFLDYRDSGMAGTADNEHRRALMQVGAADVVGKLVAIIREFRPQVIITFDEAGGYGHPDHIAIYRYTTSAFHAAADEVLYPELGPAHAAAKLYYTSLSRRQMLSMAEWLQGQEYDNVLKGLDPNALGLPDDQISVVLDVEQWNATKERARVQHRTQLNPNTPIAGMPPELQRKWRATESYQLATSRVGPDNPGENDLFAHTDSL